MSNRAKWFLNKEEVGKSCGTNSGKTFKVYIAKILPLVTFGKPKTKDVTLKSSCFVNASKCRPSISSKVKTKNYIDVAVSSTASIDSASHGTKLKISVRDGTVNYLSVEGKANKT